MSNPFKAYELRGVYGRDFDEDTVYRIGRVLPGLLHAKAVLVGRDPRVSSPELHAALCRGITESGADVADLGICTTPTTYYFTGEDGFDSAVMITASHNPPEYNGLKFSRTGALPVGCDSGLKDIERAIAAPLPPPAAERGAIRPFDWKPRYLAYFRERLPDLSGLRFAVDTSNGSAGLLARDLYGDAALYINERLDGTFPNHSPNPLLPEATEQLRHVVEWEKLDFGVIYDGDADRCMFVDNRARFVRPDLVVALLARAYLRDEPGANILCDIRTSRSVTEDIRRHGGVPHLWKVGHAFAKVRLRELRGPVGGELAGHYYFRDFHGCDSAVLASCFVIGAVREAKAAGKTFADVIDELDAYANTGETNFTVEDKAGALAAVAEWARSLAPETTLDFDGIRFEWPDWWFNLRASNTEPYLRLIAEARTRELLDAKVAALRERLAPFLSK